MKKPQPMRDRHQVHTRNIQEGCRKRVGSCEEDGLLCCRQLNQVRLRGDRCIDNGNEMLSEVLSNLGSWTVGDFLQGGKQMATVMCFFEVEDGERWENAWKKGTLGNRHDGLFAGVATVRTFRDPENENRKGTLFEIDDMEKFQALMASDAALAAGAEDGVRQQSIQLLVELAP